MRTADAPVRAFFALASIRSSCDCLMSHGDAGAARGIEPTSDFAMSDPVSRGAGSGF